MPIREGRPFWHSASDVQQVKYHIRYQADTEDFQGSLVETFDLQFMRKKSGR